MKTLFRLIRGAGLSRGPDRWLAGVCGGVAAKASVDVAYVRIGFLIFMLLPGPAVIFYLIAWLLLPAQNGRIVLQDFLDNRTGNAS